MNLDQLLAEEDEIAQEAEASQQSIPAAAITAQPQRDLEELLQEEEEVIAIAASDESSSSKTNGQDQDAEQQPGNKKEIIEKCIVCSKPNVENKMLVHFKVAICYVCKSSDPQYKLMTKTRAKQEYLLNDKILDKMNSLSINNPRHGAWSSMRLYLTCQVQQACIQKYGSLEEMEKVKETRIRTRMGRQQDAISRKRKRGTSILSSAIQKLRKEMSSAGSGGTGIGDMNKVEKSTSGDKNSPKETTKRRPKHENKNKHKQKMKSKSKKASSSRDKDKDPNSKHKSKHRNRFHTHEFDTEKHLGEDKW
eukprot:CAMPEP_0204872506 /NCGR_PEP_ID=MMETSP1348-20121228/38357_1 /ASSEMBLY_ACC=CAM_ASM_000700 /TAXON_ID=215587 /ORGANISM="Aplanochytrium stocchinoi, Strain GSBS06" /LENGTH=306 /DNA_ID=CAMNT_0052027399 /DNA_START=35 /DNA_END=952 /DNA_ORIENTATION=-